MSKQYAERRQEEEDKAKHKGKKQKRETPCRVKKRQWGHCNICGEEYIITQGVIYCTICEMENHVWQEGLYIPWIEKGRKLLDCNHKVNKYKNVTIQKCPTCGSTKSTLCPACKQTKVWKSPLNDKIVCPGCGYRND